MRRYLLLLLLFIVLRPVEAQSVTWLAWTYDDLNGEMIQLDSTGFTRQSVILPTIAGYDYPDHVAVSPQGNHVAYTLTSTTGASVFTIYDFIQHVNVMSYTIPVNHAMGSLTYAAPSEVFAADSSKVAFAYGDFNGWTLLVFDMTGQIIQQMSQQNTGEIPVPLWVDGESVHVVMMPLASGGFTSLDSAVWNIQANTLQPTDLFPVLNADLEPRTGEIIYPILDTRYTDRSGEFGFHNNSVQGAGLPLPFYVDEINTLDEAYFIQNGERVLLQVTQLDGDSYGALIVIERSGAQVELLPYENMTVDSVFDVGDGFIFSAQTAELARFFPALNGANSTAVVYVPTANSNPDQVIFAGLSGTSARVVWAQDIIARNLPNSITWGQVGNPPSSTGMTDQLSVGGMARVTLAGDGLNMRSSPSVGASVITQLNALDIFDVMDGPIIADGFVWWQLSNGSITGWAAAGDATELWLEVYTGGTFPTPISSGVTLLSPQDGNDFYAFQVSFNGQPLPPVFEWQAVTGATEYVLEFENCTGESCIPIMAFYTPQNSYSVNLFDFGFGDYRWRVVVSGGDVSEWRYFSFQQ